MVFPCARHVIHYLVPVQPRICPDMTDFFDPDVKYQLQIIEVNSCSMPMCLKNCYLEKAQ